MPANELTHHSDSGKICTKCGDALIAPEWSQYMDERRVFNLWSCTKCGSCFAEVWVSLPGDAERQGALPSRLVA
jgi:hypothetical protein